jgi:hypothetical protein
VAAAHEDGEYLKRKTRGGLIRTSRGIVLFSLAVLLLLRPAPDYYRFTPIASKSFSLLRPRDPQQLLRLVEGWELLEEKTSTNLHLRYCN